MGTHRAWSYFFTIVFGALLSSTLCMAQPSTQKLHVPSPDWRDQIIYFLMTDRFNDADASNNDQGAGEFDPTSNAKYNGGDLKGVQQKLDYIKGLGATAVWITPPVANQWWDPLMKYAGYHGYWAENFMKLDRHVGTLSDYKALSHELHSKGMYLVQDIVLNHTGNFFSYDGAWDAKTPVKNFALNTQAKPASAPSQVPFNFNDVRNPQHRKAAIYHWTPNISNYQNPQEVLNFQTSELDDLNTENPVVRQALRESYAYWIREVGVDAFRLDTALYVPPEMLSDFLYNKSAQHPGMKSAAQATGREAFYVFGEGFAIDKPFSDMQARKIDRYMSAPNGRPILPGMLNFPLYGTLGDVFARGSPTAELGYRIRSMMALHKRPHFMATFVDNHDVDRFLAGGTQAGLKQALLAIMTLPGIPTIYYGTEQGFTEQRGAMFKAGFKSGGTDRFDAAAPLYTFIKSAAALRREHRVFSRGVPKVLYENAAQPGAFAFQMRDANEAAIVVFNTSESESLMANVQTGLPSGTRLKSLFDIEGRPTDIVVGQGGRITLRLAPRAGKVWKVTPDRGALDASLALIKINAPKAVQTASDFAVSGFAKPVKNIKLVVDGDLASAQTVQPASDGRWSARLDTSAFIEPAMTHSLVALSAESGSVSSTQYFKVQPQWRVLADVPDAANDDVGASGQYRYPTDFSWGKNRQMDIRHVRVSGAGGAMKIELQMNALTKSWSPQNGFDHVAFTIFIELPGAPGGATVMPLQNATLPAGMTWHYRLRSHGWSNTLFSAAKASTTYEGTPAQSAAKLGVNSNTNTVSFTISSAALGKPATLKGAKIYATTWDYDGGYRELTQAGGGYSFGGGDGKTQPLVMDDTAVINLQ